MQLKLEQLAMKIMQDSCTQNKPTLLDMKHVAEVLSHAIQLFFFFVNSAKGCGDPENIRNGDVSFSRTTVGSKATYECDKGFSLVGAKTRVCQRSGDWEPAVPSCRRKTKQKTV